jgi:hypothetical protein
MIFFPELFATYISMALPQLGLFATTTITSDFSIYSKSFASANIKYNQRWIQRIISIGILNIYDVDTRYCLLMF